MSGGYGFGLLAILRRNLTGCRLIIDVDGGTVVVERQGPDGGLLRSEPLPLETWDDLRRLATMRPVYRG